MVSFTTGGGASSSFTNNATLVRLNDGREVRADALQNGDVYMANGAWVKVNSVPVVS